MNDFRITHKYSTIFCAIVFCLFLSGCGIIQKYTSSEPYQEPVVELLPENEYTANSPIPYLLPPHGEVSQDTPPVTVAQIHVKQCRLYKNLNEAGLDPSDKTKYSTESPLTNDMPAGSTREDAFQKLMKYPLVLITLDVKNNILDDDVKDFEGAFDISNMALVSLDANKKELGSYHLANYNSAPPAKEKDFFHVESSPGESKELTIGYFIDPEQTPPETLLLVLNPLSEPQLTTYVSLGLTNSNAP